MEKPDFEQIASFRSDISDHSMFLGFKAGCEQVWDTHVVPLQEENMREKARKEDIRRSYDQMTRQIAIIVNEREKLESENKALREENTRLTTKFIEERTCC